MVELVAAVEHHGHAVRDGSEAPNREAKVRLGEVPEGNVAHAVRAPPHLDHRGQESVVAPKHHAPRRLCRTEPETRARARASHKNNTPARDGQEQPPPTSTPDDSCGRVLPPYPRELVHGAGESPGRARRRVDDARGRARDAPVRHERLRRGPQV